MLTAGERIDADAASAALLSSRRAVTKISPLAGCRHVGWPADAISHGRAIGIRRSAAAGRRRPSRAGQPFRDDFRPISRHAGARRQEFGFQHYIAGIFPQRFRRFLADAGNWLPAKVTASARSAIFTPDAADREALTRYPHMNKGFSLLPSRGRMAPCFSYHDFSHAPCLRQNLLIYRHDI